MGCDLTKSVPKCLGFGNVTIGVQSCYFRGNTTCCCQQKVPAAACRIDDFIRRRYLKCHDCGTHHAKAKRDGKYKGRKATARAKAGDVVAMTAAGVGPTEIATRLGIGRASVYRVLAMRDVNGQVS